MTREQMRNYYGERHGATLRDLGEGLAEVITYTRRCECGTWLTEETQGHGTLGASYPGGSLLCPGHIRKAKRVVVMVWAGPTGTAYGWRKATPRERQAVLATP